MNSFLELLPEQIAENSIVIVYGPPSSGKTSFAKFLGRTPTGAHFCLGEKIQEWGFKNYPASFFSTKYCELIKSALDDFKKNKRFRLFMFDGVKSFADAKKIFEISNEVGVPISCAFILETVTGIDELERRRRDEDRNVLLERFQKYTNNKSLVLTFLKEKGVTMFTRNVANCKLVVFPWNGSTFPATKHLLSLLKISSPYCPWMPSGFVHTQKILNWVSSPNFFVSHKADGVRKTLLVLPEGCFFMDRSEAVEKVSILCGKDSPVVSLPVNSVLDGEYVVQNTQQYFIVFDALCISGRPIWHLTFAERLQELMSASGLATIQTSSKVSNDIWAVVKDYTRSSHNAIAAVLDYLPWFPADGLIFTPNILLHHSIVGKIIVVDPFIYTPYVFGPDKLFFKWQSVSQIRCEVLGISCKLFPAMFHNPMKIQFSPTNIVQFKWNGRWEAQLIRTDKTTGNSLSTVEELTQICKNPLLQEHLLGQKTPSIQQINNNCNDVNSVADSISSLSIVSQEEHNQIPTDFDLLFARIQTLLQDDLISENTDLLSGLTIYNYKAKLPKTANFRGLVLHIPSKTIVATPFSKFSASSEMKFVNPDDEVEITEKVDGSLGIVFVWKGKLYVATRRRFDSEQAIWASNWLEHYACTTTFQEGWTYLFEIIYSNNQVVIGYPYEGLVLLTANDPQGNEVSYESLIELRNNLNSKLDIKEKDNSYGKVMLPFRYLVKASDALPILYHLTHKNLRCEGGIIKLKNGTRVKFVSSDWEQAWKAIQDVHPQTIWMCINLNFRFAALRMPLIRCLLQPSLRWGGVGTKAAHIIFHPAATYKLYRGLEIPGYTPSPHFKQTFAKAWKPFPEDYGHFDQNFSSLVFQCPVEIRVHFLSFSCLPKMAQVCRDFRDLVKKQHTLTKLYSEAKSNAELQKFYYSDSDSDNDYDFSYYSNGYGSY